MRYSKSFIPTQAFNPCTWCYYESNFATEDEYQEDLDKTRWWGTSYSMETDQFEVSFSDTTNCIPKLTMIIKYKVRNGKKVWRSQVVRYVCNGIYYKNKKDLLERYNVVFNFIK